MGIFKRKKRILVISLDGVPFSFIKKGIEEGLFPLFSKLFTEGAFGRMSSVLPTISSVAWTSYMSGKNPGEHGIFGFIDRRPSPLSLFIPTGRDRKAEFIQEVLSREKKRVISINIPMTTPPFEVNGILVSGFLSTRIEKATYPPDFSKVLKDIGYIIDANPTKAKERKDEYLDDLFYALRKRFELAERLIKDRWDYFHLHVMETDRINHFFWRKKDERFWRFYSEVEGLTLSLAEKAKDALLILLSDHGFCRLEKEVYVNKYLEDGGYLFFDKEHPEGIMDISEKTIAYSLIPGRVYINLKGREEKGRVEPDDYERVREELLSYLQDMKVDGEPVVKKVWRREEIYSGPYTQLAPDLVIEPACGFDLKGDLKRDSLFSKTHIEGMHTKDDAFLFVRWREFTKDTISIYDLFPSILSEFSIKRKSDGEICWRG